jgi:hypothetical protein
MGINSPEGNRERILAFGPPGAGKSRTYVDIYDRIDGDMYVVDTDVAVARMFADKDQSRLDYTEALDYETATKAIQKYAAQADPEDWLVVDLLTPTWPWCQDFWAMKKGKAKKGEDLSMWMSEGKKDDYDWPTINRMYNNFMLPIMQTQAHVFVVTEEVDVMEGAFEGDVDRLYKDFGVKPRGNKRVPYLFHTSLHFGTKNYKTHTEYNISAPKERVGRDCDWHEEPFDDQSFVDEYLINMAGWDSGEPKRPRRRKNG